MNQTIISNYCKLGLSLPLDDIPDKIYHFRLFEICRACGSHVPTEGYKCSKCVECIGYERQFLTTSSGYVEIVDKRNVMTVINDIKRRFNYKLRCLNTMRVDASTRREMMAKILDLNSTDYAVDLKSVEFCQLCQTHVPTFGLMCVQCPTRRVIIDEIIYCATCTNLPTSDICKECTASIRTTSVAENIIRENARDTIRFMFSRHLSCRKYDKLYDDLQRDYDDDDDFGNAEMLDIARFIGGDEEIFYNVTLEDHLQNLNQHIEIGLPIATTVANDTNVITTDASVTDDDRSSEQQPITYRKPCDYLVEPIVFDTKFGFVKDTFSTREIFKWIFSIIHNEYTTINRLNAKRILNEFCANCLAHIPTVGIHCDQCFYVKNKYAEIIYPVEFCKQHRLNDNRYKSCTLKCRNEKYVHINDINTYQFELSRRKYEMQHLATQYKLASSVENRETIKRRILNVSDTLYAAVDKFRIWFNHPTFTSYCKIPIMKHYVNKILTIKSRFYFCAYCDAYLPVKSHDKSCPCKYKFNAVKRILKTNKRCVRCDFDVSRCNDCVRNVVEKIDMYVQSYLTASFHQAPSRDDHRCFKCRWKLERCNHDDNNKKKIRRRTTTAPPPRKRRKVFS